MDGQGNGGTATSQQSASASLRGVLEDVKIIATGGMSQIFRARQPGLDRYIVIKKLKEQLLSHAETVERFRREAKALASVLHQNIAHVYDFVEGAEEPYILMEYIEGIDVSKVVEKVGHVPPRVAAAILLNVAKGVGYIHAHHLIHRDIKPSNIRLTSRGEVKLMDFGIVVDLQNDALTRPGMMVGSPFYLSPEQVLGDPVTPRADIFLMGICLYEMVTGTRPFKDEGNETVFQRIREAKFIPARQMQSQLPLAVELIIKKCLHKNPDKRFQSTKELVTALERFLGPAASSHTEDIILKYLDEEALVDASIPYAEVFERRLRLRDALTTTQLAALIAGILLLTAGAAFTGYKWGSSRAAAKAPAATAAGGAVTFPGPVKRAPKSLGSPRTTR